jgi:hypothetical protein
MQQRFSPTNAADKLKASSLFDNRNVKIALQLTVRCSHDATQQTYSKLQLLHTSGPLICRKQCLSLDWALSSDARTVFHAGDPCCKEDQFDLSLHNDEKKGAVHLQSVNWDAPHLSLPQNYAISLCLNRRYSSICLTDFDPWLVINTGAINNCCIAVCSCSSNASLDATSPATCR